MLAPGNYQEALAQAGNYRFQIAQCHGIPGSMTAKAGKRIAIDNRNGTAHTIAVDDASVTVPGYRVALMTVQYPVLYTIPCDGGGAIEILIAP